VVISILELLQKQEPERLLFLAVPEDVWNTVFQEPIGETARETCLDRIVRVDPTRERIVQWLPPPNGAT
jgi:hypothetical protein